MILINEGYRPEQPHIPTREEIIDSLKDKPLYTEADIEQLQLFLKKEQEEAVKTHGPYACVKFSIFTAKLYFDLGLTEEANTSAIAACTVFDNEMKLLENKDLPQVLSSLGGELEKVLHEINLL